MTIGLRGLCLAVAAATLMSAPATAGDCTRFCESPEPTVLLAYDDEDRDYYRERRRRRDKRREAREERYMRKMEERDIRDRRRDRLRSLERQLKGPSSSRSRDYESRYSSSRSEKRSRRTGGSGMCMYGIDGKLIHQPPGRLCAPTRDEQAAVMSQDPAGQGTVGCVAGNCLGGQGTYVWPNGARYVGAFQSGVQHGQGTMTYANGASYTGEWKAGKRSGMGTAFYPTGQTQSGYWAENRFVKATSTPPQHAQGGAPSSIAWPDLSRNVRPIGGGARDVAVIVGIERYAHVAEIAGADQNARDWYRYLVKSRGVPAERVTLLLDEDATREEMLYSAQQAAKLADPKGSLWFVFVGHGSPSPEGEDGLLVGFDAQQRARSLSARSLAQSDLVAALEETRAAHVNVLLDACFSGRTSAGAPLVKGLQPLVVTTTNVTSDPRFTLMTAAHQDQYAGPLPGKARPAFSYLVLGGLRGWADADENGEVAARELHEYVSGAMRVLVRGRRQEPTLIGGEGIVLAHSARESGPDLSELVLGSSASPPARTR